MQRKPDVIEDYAKAGGPVPRYGSGSIATGFWRGYMHGPRGADGSIQGRAIRAGAARANVDRDLMKHPNAPGQQGRRVA